MDKLDEILQYIDNHEEEFIDNLRAAVAIKNVSTWKNQRSTYNEFNKMVSLMENKLKELGFEVEIRQVGNSQQMDDETEEPLPPVIFATLETDPDNETLLIYGHMDVQPAKLSDGWDNDPFVLTEKDGNLYGRGASDDKGPCLGWLHCIEAFVNCNVSIPVNLKIVLESLEEVGSEGLENLLKSEQNKFLCDVDMVVISDNYWLGTSHPCITYGLRGLLYMSITVDGGTKDLHSGVFGGAIQEPMWDMIWMLNQLVDNKGNIIIPGLRTDDVEPLTTNEKQQYKNLNFCLEDFRKETGVHKLRFPDSKEKTLMARWRYPSLSIHGIEGAFSDAGTKTVIPRKVIGKFSIRLVPNQTPKKVEKTVTTYLQRKWAQRDSPNKFSITTNGSGKPWKEKIEHKNYQAAAAAIRRIYNLDPMYTREGGSIPVTLVFKELTKKNVLLLPMGESDDGGAHSQNEKISKKNYISGTKVFAAYIMELAYSNNDSSCK